MEYPDITSLKAAYYQLHNFEQKLHFLETSIQKWATCSSTPINFLKELYMSMAELLFQRGWYPESIEAASVVLELNPKQSEMLAILQECETIQKLYQKAYHYHQNFLYRKEVECYQQILNKSYEDTNAWYNAGNAYLLQHEYGKAIECYENVLQIDPNDEQAWYNLAYTYEKYNLPEQALDAYSQLLRLNPQHSKAWLNRGHIHFITANLTQAKKDYQQAYELGEEEALYLLAQIEKLPQNHQQHE